MLKNIITIIISIVFLSSVSFAECSKPVTSVKSGSIVPCDGYIFTADAEAENYRKLQQGALYKQLSENQEEQNKILQTRLNDYIEYSNDLNKEVRKNNLEKILYGIGGALIMYGAFQLANH